MGLVFPWHALSSAKILMTLETLPWFLPAHYPKEDKCFLQLAGTYMRPVLPSLASARLDAPLSHLLGCCQFPSSWAVLGSSSSQLRETQGSAEHCKVVRSLSAEEPPVVWPFP